MIFVIVISLTLSVYIYYNGKDLSCDTCELKFYTQHALHEDYFGFGIMANDLYESFMDDQCKVTWDRVQGYRRQ